MKAEINDLLALLSNELDLDEGDIGSESTMDQVEYWDSLGHLRVCMAIEAKFGVSIPLDTVAELTSVPAIMAFLAAT